MLSCTFSMFWTTVTSQTSSEKRRTNRHTVKPTVMFGSRAGFRKGSHSLPCFHTTKVAGRRGAGELLQGPRPHRTVNEHGTLVLPSRRVLTCWVAPQVTSVPPFGSSFSVQTHLIDGQEDQGSLLKRRDFLCTNLRVQPPVKQDHSEDDPVP